VHATGDVGNEVESYPQDFYKVYIFYCAAFKVNVGKVTTLFPTNM